MLYFLFILSLLGWFLLLLRITGLDRKLYNKYMAKRNRSKTAFANKRIVISGASSGIGAELARQYASMGASLFIGARRQDLLAEMCQVCTQLGASKCEFAKLDVTDEQSCKLFIQQAAAALQGIDMLILNAGVGCIYELSEVSNLENHKQLMNVNFWGCAQLTLDALPELKKSKGTVAVVSSLSGKFPVPKRTAYCASKFALHGFFGALRLEMIPHQVHVCILCPGYVMTDFQQSSIGAKNVDKNASHFTSVQDCASELIDAVEDHVAEHIMTLKGKVANALTPLVPSSWIDAMIIRTAKGAASYKQ